MSLLSDICSIDDLEVENQRVLVRADLDAPRNKAGEFLDDACIRAVAPTVAKLQSQGAQVVIASRFGDGRTDKAGRKSAPPSIESAASRLSAILDCDVLLPDSCSGEAVKKVLAEQKSGQITVLENLALEGDTGLESEAFARRLAHLFDIFVADSLRVLDKESATTTLLPRLCEQRAAGVSLMRELAAATRVQSGIDNPRLIIWGGNSLSGRLDVLTQLLQQDTTVYLAGVAANTMLTALGENLGKSFIEEGYLAGARSLYERLGSRLVLPLDFGVGKGPRSIERVDRQASALQSDDVALDLGPRSVKQLEELASKAKTILFCGSVGFFKSSVYQTGTRAVCQTMADSGAFSMVFGDDSVASVHTAGQEFLPHLDCVSLGSTATLSLLKNNKLPGLTALFGATHE